MTKFYEVKIKYANTLLKKFEKNISLIKGEKIYSRLVCMPLGIVAVTNKRIIFLKHKLFFPDKLLYIPFDKIKKVKLKNRNSMLGDNILIIEYDDSSIKFGFMDRPLSLFNEYYLLDPKKNKLFLELLRKRLPNSKIVVEEL